MQSIFVHLILRAALAVSLICMAVERAAAVESNWINPNGGLFNTQTNWDGFVPLSNATALFDLPNSYSVTMTTSRTTDRLTVNRGNVQLLLGGVTYTLGSGMYVGDAAGQHGVLSMTNGIVQGINLNVGVDAGDQGTLTLGANLRATFVGNARVGAGGWGSLTLRDGATLIDQGSSLGHSATGYGTALVTGWQTKWQTAALTVGSAGNGMLTVNDRARLESQQTVLGLNSNTTGTVTIDGTGTRWLNSSAVTVGAGGSGRIEVQNGAVVESGSALLAASIGSSGMVNLTGSGSEWIVDGAIEVGRSGLAELTVNSGAFLQSASGQVASLAGSNASVTLSGAESTWQLQGNLAIGGSENALGGTAEMHVNNGAVLDLANSASSTLKIWEGSHLEIDGGTVRTGALDKRGSLNFHDGTLEIVGGTLGSNSLSSIDGGDTDAAPVLRLIGGATADWTNTLTVGQVRRGTMQLESGASAIIAGDLLVGAGQTANGVIDVKNGARIELGGDLLLGGSAFAAGGSGTVTLQSGGSMTADNGAVILWPQGSLKLDGGHLDAGSLEFRGGSIAFSTGTMRLTSPVSMDLIWLTRVVGSSHSLGNGQTLELGEATISGSLSVQGGSLSAEQLTLSAPLQLSAGSLAVHQQMQIAPQGLLHVEGISTTNFTGGLMNDGELAMQSALATVEGGTLDNRGVVRGNGRINMPLNNLSNGRVQVGANERLQFLATENTNSGTIEVGTSGAIEFLNELQNTVSGRIIARDSSLQFGGGLQNDGELLLSGGAIDIAGAINTSSGGRIAVAGGTEAVFQNVLDLSGTVEVYNGSSALFLQNVVGEGDLIVHAGGRLELVGTTDFTPLLTASVNSGSMETEKTPLSGVILTGGISANSYIAPVVENHGTLQFSRGDTPGATHAMRSISGNGATVVADGVELSAGQVEQQSLSIGAGATLTLDRPSSTLPLAGTEGSHVGALQIAGGATPTGTIDIGSSALVIQSSQGLSATVLETTVAQIKSAQNRVGGRALWNGPGISSTDAWEANQMAGGELLGLAALRNGDFTALGLPIRNTFAGHSVNADSILVSYALIGDANLDGVVDFDDYGLIDGAFSGALPNLGWISGDFNYDGVVDFDDYGLMDFAFSRQDVLAALAGADPGTVVVPEPGTCGLFVLAIFILTGSKRLSLIQRHSPELLRGPHG
ncbi:MAG: hypothetical protein SGJ20_12565 [Planctomycetota bacterium]|nr:hypothetical protein [Planctomycetota bacterium]